MKVYWDAQRFRNIENGRKFLRAAPHGERHFDPVDAVFYDQRCQFMQLAKDRYIRERWRHLQLGAAIDRSDQYLPGVLPDPTGSLDPYGPCSH